MIINKHDIYKKEYNQTYDIIKHLNVGIEPLKARYDVTKLDLTILLLSFWCIDINLSIQFMSLTLYMTWVS